MTNKDRSFQSFFNKLDRKAKVRLSNRRIQRLDADLAFCYAFGVEDTSDSWYLFSIKELHEMRQRWMDVRDRLVWTDEEVNLD